MSKQVTSAGSRAEATSASNREAKTEPTFEKALAELEKIVARMESGELSLEEALATHKRGTELARFCQQKLEVAQQQVKVLEGEILKPLSAIEEPGDSGPG